MCRRPTRPSATTTDRKPRPGPLGSSRSSKVSRSTTTTTSSTAPIITDHCSPDSSHVACLRFAPVRLITLVLAIAGVLLIAGCDPSADFVYGHYVNAGHTFVLDASSGPSGENPKGTLKADGQLF